MFCRKKKNIHGSAFARCEWGVGEAKRCPYFELVVILGVIYSK